MHPSPPPYGRDRELAVLDDLIRRVPARGGALVVHVEAGVVKSAP